MSNQTTQHGAIDPDAIPTHTFDWGVIKWFVEPATTPGATLTFGEVVVLPGKGHGRHNHPDSEEILYVLSGQGDQTIDGVNGGAPFPVRAGDTIYIPGGVFHSTTNTGWEPMRVLALYNPAGPENDLSGLPDHQELAGGQPSGWKRG